MNPINVDGLDFHFPDGWLASKYDKWSFYNNQFKKLPGTKAVDLLALSPEKTAYLIEVKDYRRPDTERPSELPQALANKVRL